MENLILQSLDLISQDYTTICQELTALIIFVCIVMICQLILITILTSLREEMMEHIQTQNELLCEIIDNTEYIKREVRNEKEQLKEIETTEQHLKELLEEYDTRTSLYSI